jgi:hypothetical protein
MKKYMALAPSDRFRKMITFELGMVLYNNRELINKTWQGNISKEYLDYNEELKHKNNNSKNIDNLFIDNNNQNNNNNQNDNNSKSSNIPSLNCLSSDSSSTDSSSSNSSSTDSSSSNSSSTDKSNNIKSTCSSTTTNKNNKSNNKKILFHSSYTGSSSDKYSIDTTNEEADKEIEEISKAYEFLKKKKFDKEKINMLMRMLTP